MISKTVQRKEISPIGIWRGDEVSVEEDGNFFDGVVIARFNGHFTIAGTEVRTFDSNASGLTWYMYLG